MQPHTTTMKNDYYDHVDISTSVYFSMYSALKTTVQCPHHIILWQSEPCMSSANLSEIAPKLSAEKG